MEGRWRDVGGTLGGHWRDAGGTLEGRWRDVGGTLEGHWRDTGGTLEGRRRDVAGTLDGRCSTLLNIRNSSEITTVNGLPKIVSAKYRIVKHMSNTRLLKYN